MRLRSHLRPGDRTAFRIRLITRSTLRTLGIILLRSILIGSASVQSLAQAPPQARPILFVHGICSDANDWSSLTPQVINYIKTLPGSLYAGSNGAPWRLYYDQSSKTVKQWPSGAGLSSIPPTARFFAITFADPTSLSSPSSFNPTNTMEVSIINKADEVARVIQAITSITLVKDVILVGHSMGGLDSRAYLENLARPATSASCTDTDNYSSCSAAAPTKYTQDVNSLITIDTPHGGVANANVASGLKTILDVVGLFIEPCVLERTLNRRELEEGSDLENWLRDAAHLLPPNLTLISIRSYMDASVVTNQDDGVVFAYEQSFAQSIAGAPQPLSIYYDVDNKGYSLYTEIVCSQAFGQVSPLHFLSCLALQPNTVSLVEAQFNTLLQQPPGETTSIIIQATLDGVTWQGPVNFTLVGPSPQNGSSVPVPYYGETLGTYKLSNITGGPSSNFQVYPVTQSLGVDHTTGSNTWALTFTIAFCSTTCPSPSVSTGSPVNVVGDGAMLNGTVNPQGGAVTAWFEWSTDSGLVGATAGPPIAIQPVTSPVPISYSVSGLQSSTTYYYAVVASNGNGSGTVVGNPSNFHTLHFASSSGASNSAQCRCECCPTANIRLEPDKRSQFVPNSRCNESKRIAYKPDGPDLRSRLYLQRHAAVGSIHSTIGRSTVNNLLLDRSRAQPAAIRHLVPGVFLHYGSADDPQCH